MARHPAERLADPRTPIPDELAESDGFQRAIARLLGRLPAGLREPFLLVVADGYDRDDVAALEGLQPAEVTRRVARASRFLKRCLAAELGPVDLDPEALV